MRVHTGEKQFPCILCTLSFSEIQSLKVHMKNFHQADFPYICLMCSHSFKTKLEMDLHLRDEHPNCVKKERATTQFTDVGGIRRLLAVLLFRISHHELRVRLGFGERLIDDVLVDALKMGGQKPTAGATLEENISRLFDWTMPKEVLREYRANNISVPDIMEMLISY